VDFAWKDGRLAKATIRSLLGNECRVHTDGPARVTCDGKSIKTIDKGRNVVEFATQIGQAYNILVEN
jgi:hypothetical protein